MTEGPALRIIGIGSPFGDDALGHQALERLQQEDGLFPPGTELLELDRPGSSLVPLLENSRAVVIIDAMQSGQPPGTVQRLKTDELITETKLPSSHNLGVAEALALARVLNVLPERLLIYGIEAGRGVTEVQWYPELRAAVAEGIRGL